MPTYEIVNRVTKECALVDSPYAQDACERVGWQIAHCEVRLVRESPFTDITKPPRVVKLEQEG